MKEQLSLNEIRTLNKRHIIETIIKEKVVLRNELSKVNGISLMTVKHIIEDLLQEGIIEESLMDVAKGRRPKAIGIAKDYGCICCVNMASKDHLNYIIYDLSMNPIVKWSRMLDNVQPYKTHFESLLEHLKKDVDRIGLHLVGIGISVPGVYYEEEDRVNHDLVEGLEGLTIKQLFRDQFDIEIINVKHDVAMAIAYCLSQEAVDSLFYLYIGDGIGGALAIGGEIVRGYDLVAGEVGQMLVTTPKGNVRLESVASIPNVLEAVHDIYPDVTMEETLVKYEAGDQRIKTVIEGILDNVALALFNILWVINPEKFIIGSSEEKFAKLTSHYVRKKYHKKIQDLRIKGSMNIMPSATNDHETMFGCFNDVLNDWMDQVALSRSVKKEVNGYKMKGMTNDET